MIRVADYIAQSLAKFGIKHVFMVTGGGAMHLNDAFGRTKNLEVVCCHHEQTCAMAAESYFRVTHHMAAVNVTTGPGGTNAVTGVYGAYVDSMAMIVVSGQSKWETLVQSTSLPLRQLGDQEVDIVRMVKGITKYAVLVKDPESIRYHLERALYLALYARPGPVWLDIPINVQGTLINPDELRGYDKKEDAISFETSDLQSVVNALLERLKTAKRPVFYVGTGIRLAGQYENFVACAERLRIPVAPAWNSNDLLTEDSPVYAGRPGTLGDRAGNFTVQNADLLIILGCRLNIRQVSYNWNNFAPNAYKVMVDVDWAEIKKPTLKIDLPIHADLNEFFPLFDKVTSNWTPRNEDWLSWCKQRMIKYPVVLQDYWLNKNKVNPYCFMDRLFSALSVDDIITCGDGTACVTAFQAAKIKRGQRLFHNSGCASMGFDLPAAVGAAIACPARRVICLAGDGSIMMNLQELQTISGKKLPIKIFILNNSGYHSIRQTQANFFSDNIVGCGTDSGLSFPDFSKVAYSFGLPFHRCDDQQNLETVIANTLDEPLGALCEIVLDLGQAFAPKLSSRKLDDGRMITSPLEDMAPFLSREELESNILFNKI